MSTCDKCGNFYFGAECRYCAEQRKAGGVESAEVNRRLKERQERIDRFSAEWEDSFLFSTTSHLSRYIIRDYLGVVSGACALGTGFLSEFKSGFSDLFGVASDSFSCKLEEAKDDAMEKAKKNALSLEANALIGVNIEYSMFAGNMIAVVVSGTAVFVEKEQ